MARLLTDHEVDRQLVELPGWRRNADSLTRTVRCSTFPAAITLVELVAGEAERMNHHPDIDIRWRSVSFVCSTHSEGGLTQLDIELAHQIDEAVVSLAGA